MTWAKFGTEFFDQLAAAPFPDDLEDACVRTHTETCHFLFSVLTPEDVRRDDISFRKRFLPRAAYSLHRDEAAAQLVRHGFWRDTGDRYEIVSTPARDDIKGGIMAQAMKRDRDSRAQANKRRRDRERQHEN